jgi:hypothetical protein
MRTILPHSAVFVLGLFPFPSPSSFPRPCIGIRYMLNIIFIKYYLFSKNSNKINSKKKSKKSPYVQLVVTRHRRQQPQPH